MYYNNTTRTMQSLRATTPPLYYKRPENMNNTMPNNNNFNSNNNTASNVTDTNMNRGSIPAAAANMIERNVLSVVPDNEDYTYNDNNIRNKNAAKHDSLSRSNAVAQHFSNNHVKLQNVSTNNSNDSMNEYNDNVDKLIPTNNNYSNNYENEKPSLMSMYRNSTTNNNTEMYSNTSRVLPPPPSTLSSESTKSSVPYNNNINSNNGNTKLFIQPFTTPHLPSTSRESYNYSSNNNNNNYNNNNIRPSISKGNYTNTSTISNNGNDNNRVNSDANVEYFTNSKGDSRFANMRQGGLPYYNNYNNQEKQQLPSYNKRNMYDMNADRLAELEKESYALSTEEMHYKAMLLQETQTQRQQEELQLNLSRGWAQLLEAEERYYSEPLPDRSEEIHTRECVCNDLEHYLHQLNDQLEQLSAERDHLHVILTQKEALEVELTQMKSHLHNLASRQQMSRLKAEAWFELEQQRTKCGRRFVRELDRELSAMIDTDAWNAADLNSLTQEEEIKARVPHMLAQLIANNDVRVKKVEAVSLHPTNMYSNSNNNNINISVNNRNKENENATSKYVYNNITNAHFASSSNGNKSISENNTLNTLYSSGGLTNSHLTENTMLSNNTALHNARCDTLSTSNLCGGGPSFCIGLNDASDDDDNNNNYDDENEKNVKSSLCNRNASSNKSNQSINNALGGKSVIFSLNNTNKNSNNMHYMKNKINLQHKRAKVEVVNA